MAGFSPIVPNPIVGRTVDQEALELLLKTVEGDYIAVDGFEGSKHLGVWPLANAAQSCFGAREWPDDIPVLQATIEFEVPDVQAASTKLTARGYNLIHEVSTEPWDQVIARLLGPEDLLVGVCWCPWMHDE